ncbi:MAG: protease complex subunit PrcB family protein [Lachnospiraceae bacterium]
MRKLTVGLLFVMMVTAFGCSNRKEEKPQVLEKLDFSVVSDECLPEELKTEIDKKKAQPFQMTFMDDGFLYICIGYGEQKSGGYSIQVNACNRLKNAILVDTNLLGPKPKNTTRPKPKEEGKSYPYIVLKTKDINLPVIFE